MEALYVHDLVCIDPPHHFPQKQSLEWLRKSYIRYQKDQNRSEEDFEKIISRVGVSESQISNRNYYLPDFHLPPSEAEIFGEAAVEGVSKRQTQFAGFTNQILQKIYEQRKLPEHLIHVTCTGYGSPSAAQLIAAEKSPTTVVTHSYHMGCYGVFPALRMAGGFLNSSSLFAQSSAVAPAVDIVHTELCSLHLNPLDPSLEQIVIQTLFSDGAAVYRMSTEKPAGPSFQLLHLGEFLLPNTSEAMHWSVSEGGMAMGLSKNVPGLIASSLKKTLEIWEFQTGLAILSQLKEAIVAVHPGGPKIIDLVKQSLELKEVQVAASRKVLYERGNMSSATIPHVWAEILRDSNSAGKLVLSMAFGPGLTLAMSLMRVVE